MKEGKKSENLVSFLGLIVGDSQTISSRNTQMVAEEHFLFIEQKILRINVLLKIRNNVTACFIQ